MVPYQDSALEKFYVYLRYLIHTLPKDPNVKFQLDDEVALKYFRIQKISEGSISLQEGENPPLKGPPDVGTGKPHEEYVKLSSLVEKLNERFGTEFTEADQLFFNQIAQSALENEKIQEAAKANSIDNFKLIFEKMVEGLFIDRMAGNEEIFAKLMKDDRFKALATDHLLREVYEMVRNT
jgi:type I restriction enzyme R subunit